MVAVPEDFDCPVCFEPVRQDRAMLLGCYHVFCSGCAVAAVKARQQCPLCRFTVRADAVLPLQHRSPFARCGSKVADDRLQNMFFSTSVSSTISARCEMGSASVWKC